MTKKTTNYSTLRWHYTDSYKLQWLDRNKFLFGLLEELDLPISEMSCIEYGCGPHTPFKSLYGNRFKSISICDTKKWNDEVILLDLNKSNSFLKSDIAVLSGVLEYLDDLPAVLGKFEICNSYLLISYYPVKEKYSLINSLKAMFFRNQLLKIKEFKKRIFLGCKNHLNSSDFFKLISQHFVIENIDTYENQIIILVKTRKALD